MSQFKRFYKSVSIQKQDAGFCVCLDDKPLKNSQGKVVFIDKEALAFKVKQEWDIQNDHVILYTMPMTRLVMGYANLQESDRGFFVDSVMKYADYDCLYYYADYPQKLQKLQREKWQPAQKYIEKRLTICFYTTYGICSVEQADATIQALKKDVEKLSLPVMFSFNQMTHLTGSLILSLNALYNDKLNHEHIWELSQLEYLFHRDVWGHDEEAHTKYINDRRDFMSTYDFCLLNY